MARNSLKSKRIILELLHNPDGKLTLYRLSKLTDTNISWVIVFIKRLENKKLVKKTKVLNFSGLIDYYLFLDVKPKFFEFQLTEPLEYLRRVSKVYALTTFAAENLTSHHLFPSRIDLYVKLEDIGEWKKELFDKGLIGKGNLRLIVISDNYLFKFSQELKGLKIISVPLLLIDLKREGGVCLEAYDYLVKKYVSGSRN